MALFDNVDEFSKIKTPIYLDITTRLQPKLNKISKSKGEAYFRKYCFFAFRQKLKVENNKNEGKIITSVIFCLNKEATDSELANFYKEFNERYTKAVINENDFNLIQRYRLKQNIFIQYYAGVTTTQKK